ncbi:MAG: glutamate racemase [Bdellovibrionota bacterium]
MINPNIAFFDSGQGGLTIWENVLKKFPNLNTQYMGDNARCPYGNKSNETIIQYATEAFSFLAARKAMLIVVACGTVSSVAVKYLQNEYKIPIIGIVEGFCQFVAQILEDSARTVAVIATRYTIKSKRFLDELSLYGIHNVWDRACPLFVPLVEEGIAQGSIVDAACDMYLWDIPRNVKVVMLACTHYPRIVLPIAQSLSRLTGRSVISKTIDGDWLLSLGDNNREDPIYLVDASSSIVQYIDGFLKGHGLVENLLSIGEQKVLCTDSPLDFENAARFFTNSSLKNIEAVNLMPLTKQGC